MDRTISQRNEDWAVPVDSPAYPLLPTYYRDVLFVTVPFRTAPANVQPMLPKSLEATKTGLCAAFGIRVGFSSAYGPFNEMGVAVEASFKGKTGFYLTSLFLNSSDPISAGREIYGSPKKYAEVSIDRCGNELTFICRRAGIAIITLNSRISDKAEEHELPRLFPMYVLKTVPMIDRNDVMTKQICVNAPPEDVRTHELFKGPGVVKFEPTVAGDFWRLSPLETLGAFYQVIDYTQGFGSVIHQYSIGMEKKALA